MSFEALLDELETMAKAIPSDAGEDDAKIQAAAEEGGEGDGVEGGDELGAVDGESEGEGEFADEDEEDEQPAMAKSFRFTLEDGTEVEAQDGTELVKSLMARVETNEESMTKALGTAVDLIKSQGEMIKSLQGQVSKLSGQGRGRKAVVSVTEKVDTTLAKSQQAPEEGLTAGEFMAKALSAQAAGRITGSDVARAESYLNKGLSVPVEIVSRVLQ